MLRVDHFTDSLIEFLRQESAQPFLAYYPMALTYDPFEPTATPWRRC